MTIVTLKLQHHTVKNVTKFLFYYYEMMHILSLDDWISVLHVFTFSNQQAIQVHVIGKFGKT